jgi:hypothetical protein
MVQRLEVRKLTERSRNTNRNKRSSNNKGGGLIARLLKAKQRRQEKEKGKVSSYQSQMEQQLSVDRGVGGWMEGIQIPPLYFSAYRVGEKQGERISDI